jgi:hypothetical protein
MTCNKYIASYEELSVVGEICKIFNTIDNLLFGVGIVCMATVL